MADPNPPWRLHKTPNPAERSISLTVPMTEIAENNEAFDAFLEGSLFKNFPLIPEQSLADDKQFGLYKYKDCDEATGPNMSFMFVKAKTAKQRNTPFRRKRITERVDWDAVLKWIEFGIDSGFPLSQSIFNAQGKQAVITADRWLVPRGYQSGQKLMTIIDIEQFLSDEPYPEYLMESDEPQPTEVMWDLTGSHGTTGRVLHDTVEVPAQSSAGYRVMSSVGTPSSSNATGTKKWIFPKTNHKDRRDFEVISVEYVGGQYLKEKYLFHAPTPSKIIRQT